jgi:putative ABC transport system permease protein
VKYADQKAENVRIRGVEPITMFDIDGVSVNVGRIWTESEGAAGRDICVIGPDMLKNLFNDAPADRAVGQEIRIDGRPYVVLGVLEPLGSIFGFSRDNVVYIPYSTYQKAYGGRRSLVVFMQVRTAEELEAAEDQVRTIMHNRRHSNGDPDDEGFALETQDVFLNLYGSATSNIYIVTIGVAAISLVVGGIVVMNIMLVSVTERTFEVGLRKAVGATKRQILMQFLIESGILCALGGVIGLLISWGITTLITTLASITMTITIGYIILALGVSTIVGMIAGIYPAFKAARLDPILALTKA